MPLNPRQNRFSSQGGAGYTSNVLSGYPGGAGKDALADPIDKAFVRRNLKPYKSLRQFSTKKGLGKLQGKTDVQLERMATKAVIQEAGVKKRKLRTNVNRKKYGKNVLNRAKGKIQEGYGVRKLGQPGLNANEIRNKKLRQATKHLIHVKRNRRVMSTNIWKGQGYDIKVGHIQGPKPWKKFRTGIRKMKSPTATLKSKKQKGRSKGGKRK